MNKKCLKCGYERTHSDYGEPDYKCPSCSAVYAKVESNNKLSDKEKIQQIKQRAQSNKISNNAVHDTLPDQNRSVFYQILYFFSGLLKQSGTKVPVVCRIFYFFSGFLMLISFFGLSVLILSGFEPPIGRFMYSIMIITTFVTGAINWAIAEGLFYLHKIELNTRSKT